jgi:fumarate reductase flavoprotein subunit
MVERCADCGFDLAGGRVEVVPTAHYMMGGVVFNADCTTANGGVYISMGHLGPENVRKQFKGMVERCADCGFDLAGGLVEVVPTAHYLMGGVVCKVDTSTEVAGLYVAGEDAGGVHGANRLGGNGVANSTVFGGIAGETMARDLARGLGLRTADEDAIGAECVRAEEPFRRTAGDLNRLRESLLDMMWEDVGIVRDEGSLRRAVGRLGQIEAELLATGIGDTGRAFNMTWSDWLNLRSQIEMSQVIAQAALKRENSRGAHFRSDFPEPGDLDTSRYTIVRQFGDWLDVSDAPVEFTHVRPGESLLKEAAE